MSIVEQVENAPMGRGEIQAVALRRGMNLLDGFDTPATCFIGPAITSEWPPSPSRVGVPLRGGPAGMALGALFLARLADRVGRRGLTLSGLPMASLGMRCASVSQDFGRTGEFFGPLPVNG
ncbi:hypothetical protein [Streptomyces brasiliensis]|uniref:Major facilitator superfamily (MFS) profile domain-containing protein n=1 Tax=Streptomyces brasiliensis TaxID=1954 RepID=A0A917PD94_9ACTN|nr:hypothetical protein [Streptomyces brasiliensis]GGJ71660.1 hypothetical protein GCM10010121_097830 [Streptomyces brasiliensis]